MTTPAYLGMMGAPFQVLPEETSEPAFEREEYHARIQKIRRLMAEQKIDLLYVTTPEHVCYLHGFFASWYKANSPMRYPQVYGTAIHVDSDAFIHFDNPSELPLLTKHSISTDNRFFTSREAAPNIGFIMSQLKAQGWLDGTVAMEYWSYVPNRAISTMFEGAFLAEGCRVVDGSAIVRRVRRVKSPAEIAYIEKACALADVGHDTIRRLLRPGISEPSTYPSSRKPCRAPSRLRGLAGLEFRTPTTETSPGRPPRGGRPGRRARRGPPCGQPV